MSKTGTNDAGSPYPVRAAEKPHLRRSLGLWVLLFCGLGMIIGAGIYVLVGEVAGAAGMSAPLAFLVAAGLAALTGLSYAELVGRYPEAAGEVAYVQQAFGSRVLATIVGCAIILVAVVARAIDAAATTGPDGRGRPVFSPYPGRFRSSPPPPAPRFLSSGS